MVQVVEITAMWNLNGDDIKTAKDELESRRATLKAEYEAEVKRIDAELADIDAVERVAVTFVSSRKGDKPASASEVEPEKGTEKESSANGATEMRHGANADESGTGRGDTP